MPPPLCRGRRQADAPPLYNRLVDPGIRCRHAVSRLGGRRAALRPIVVSWVTCPRQGPAGPLLWPSHGATASGGSQDLVQPGTIGPSFFHRARRSRLFYLSRDFDRFCLQSNAFVQTFTHTLLSSLALPHRKGQCKNPPPRNSPGRLGGRIRDSEFASDDLTVGAARFESNV